MTVVFIDDRVGCEKFATCNNICVDKTAGFTENKMMLKECYIENQFSDNIEEFKMSSRTRELIGEGICVNTTSYFMEDQNPRNKHRKVIAIITADWKRIGSLSLEIRKNT